MNIDIATLRLDKGSHSDCEGACLMEARAMLLGRPKSDKCPPGTSPLLHRFGIALNDAFGDEKRQELKRFLPVNGADPLDGTADDGLDETRSYLALDWLIRTYTPAFLDLRPELADVAAELRSLRRIVDLATAGAAGPVVRAARRESAWDAARDAARAAARAAAGDAARAAAGAAARDAARAAAWAAAGAAARDAARDAARAAARAAAWAVLQPTVDRLQTSAIQLFADMIKPSAVSA